MWPYLKSLFSRQLITKKQATRSKGRNPSRRRLTTESLEERTLFSGNGFLAGTVFVGDANLTASSAKLAGAVITLYAASDTSETSPIATTTTDANGNYLFTGLNPGVYDLVETPPTGYKNNGTQVLSELNPALAIANPATNAVNNTIQVTVLDPSTISINANSSTFSNRNLWDNISFTYDGNYDPSSAGQLPITVTGTNTATSTSVSSSFLSLCWDLSNTLDNGTNIYSVLPTSGQGTPANAGQIAYLFNTYGTQDIQGTASTSVAGTISSQAIALAEMAGVPAAAAAAEYPARC